jgi:hypothetical protein
MSKTRESIPKPVRDAVLKEFNHRCAICGADRPHLHHIDENPANNELSNLIPLCPNCHLVDQHDATNAVPQAKLRFFRQHKHRLILRPQFSSLWRRILFLGDVSDTTDADELERHAEELIDFVINLQMGPFYSGQLAKLIRRPKNAGIYVLGDPEGGARRKAEQAELTCPAFFGPAEA